MSAVDSVMSVGRDDSSSRYSVSPNRQDLPICEDCERHLGELYYCNVCECTLCTRCWSRQAAHRRNSVALGSIPHEKTEIELARRIGEVFVSNVDDDTFRRLHIEDQSSAWFGKASGQALATVTNAVRNR
jgi:hypothetical protein